MNIALDLLNQGKMPERYRRNEGTLGIGGQIKLLRAKVAIIGAGGLGGTTAELLARAGVGYIRVIDGDNFEQHNLNRQLLAKESNIGTPKAIAAVNRLREVNSDINAEAIPEMLTAANATEMLTGVDVAVDGLDNIGTRLIAGRVAAKLGIPLVHAAIAGSTGQVMTILPGTRGMDDIYREGSSERGVETTLGNPSPTPALAAALQAQEVIKLITGTGETIVNKLLYFDLEQNVFELLALR